MLSLVLPLKFKGTDTRDDCTASIVAQWQYEAMVVVVGERGHVMFCVLQQRSQSKREVVSQFRGHRLDSNGNY